MAAISSGQAVPAAPVDGTGNGATAAPGHERRAMSASIEAADYADPGANMRTQPMGAIP